MFEGIDFCLQEEKRILAASRDNLDRLYRDSSNSLTILERSHRFTMEELDNQRCKVFLYSFFLANKTSPPDIVKLSAKNDSYIFPKTLGSIMLNKYGDDPLSEPLQYVLAASEPQLRI